MNNIEALSSILKEVPTTEAEEKLDYLKNLESIKIKLRQKLIDCNKNNTSYWSLDLDNNTFESNIFDITAKENGLEQYLSTYEKSTQKEISQKLETIQKDFQEFTIDRELKHPNNKSKHIREHINFIGSKNLLIGFIQDFTKTDKIQKNIQNIDKIIYQLMKLFDKNMTIIHSNKEGIITSVSSAFCQNTGFERNDIIGKSLKDFTCQTTNIDLSKIFESLKENKLTWNGEIKYKKSDNSNFWANAFISPMYNQEDDLVEFTLLCHDITTQKILEELTNYDPMTNIYNRRYYNEIIPKEINRAMRDNKKISFAMIDIDYFKQFNDIYGHRKGDEVIIKVASLLKNSLKRGSDLVFRMGGEEFCIVFSGYDDKDSLEFCEKIREDVEHLKITHSGSKTNPFVTVSIGLVVSDLAHEVIDELGLYTTSDNALYEAKSKGRNCVFVHEASKIDIF